MSDILNLDATGAAEAIRKGEVSSVELTKTCLQALDGPGRALNAVALLYEDDALRSAASADERRARGGDLPPLLGVPLAHKDMFYRAGKVTASGSLARAGFKPNQTAHVIERLDAAGAVDLGRLNMVEFALGLTGHNAITGHPRNPWQTDHLTGGSSSGPVASVAARLNFATLGSDTGGSIRVPAAACGLVGIKPTYGRVSRRGALPLSFSLDHIGPIARTTRDLALLMSVIAGHDAREPTTLAAPELVRMDGLDKGVKGLRIAVPELAGIDQEIDGLMGSASKLFTDLKAELRSCRLPDLERYNNLRRIMMSVEVASLHRHMIGKGNVYNPQTVARMRAGYYIDAGIYNEVLAVRGQELRAFVAEAFRSADILMLPAMPSPMPRIDETDLGGKQELVDLVNRLGGLVCPFNYLGLPAISVPIGLTRSGVPNGMQLVGRPYSEGLLLRAANAFEAASGFANRRPPPFGNS